MPDDQSPEQRMAPSRRAVMKGIAAVVAVGTLPAELRAAPSAPIFDFLAASSKLTGIGLDRSYAELGAVIWSLLTLEDDTGPRQLVKTVVSAPDWENRLAPLGLTATAKAVLTAWYNGTVDIAPSHLAHPTVTGLFGDLAAQAQDGQAVTVMVTYDEAVVWRSCDFTKPSATCGGPFGYWQEPA